MNTKSKIALIALIAVIVISLVTMLVINIINRRQSVPTVEEPPVITEPDSPPEPDEPTLPDPAEIKANELGKIMVLMYHQIGDSDGAWKRSAENFRKDLDTLYSQGYRLTNLQDVLSNQIRVAPGLTPVVLTFDDSSRGQFNYLIAEDGSVTIDPDSAVGIILDFNKTHPDMGVAGTFYVNAGPFGQGQYWQQKLQQLANLGFEIGNHTYSHVKLRTLDQAGVQKELARLQKLVSDVVPGYKVLSLALPNGIGAQDNTWLRSGSFEGTDYVNKAVLLVGAEPAPAPNRIGYDPYKLTRVQASEEELGKWLNYFVDYPQQKYISDGDPNTISYPTTMQDKLNPDTTGALKLNSYAPPDAETTTGK